MNRTLRDSIGKKMEIGKEIVYLTRKECIDSALPIRDLINLVEKTLGYHGEDKYEMPAKIGIHPKENTFMHAMPAYIEDGHFCGIKWVTGFPENRAKYGLEQTVGLSILNDHETGYPLVLLDATWVTTERTAAVSMVGIKHLANTNARSFGMIGCGAVGRKHVEMIEEVMPNLEEIFILDNFEPAMDRLIEDYQPHTNAKIKKSESYEHLVKSSEVVASATAFIKGQEPKIMDEWVTSGQTLILCDAHTLYENKTMNRGDKYLLDSLEHHQLFEKQGDYPYGLPELYSELGKVVAGKVKGREHAEELIISNNIGLAIQDIMLSSAISKNAIEDGLGVKLPL